MRSASEQRKPMRYCVKVNVAKSQLFKTAVATSVVRYLSSRFTGKCAEWTSSCFFGVYSDGHQLAVDFDAPGDEKVLKSELVNPDRRHTRRNSCAECDWQPKSSSNSSTGTSIFSS